MIGVSVVSDTVAKKMKESEARLKKIFRGLIKEDFMAVVKEANKDVRELGKNWKNNEDAEAHYRPFYERVKDQCDSFELFASTCMADLQYNFIGGTIV